MFQKVELMKAVETDQENILHGFDCTYLISSMVTIL